MGAYDISFTLPGTYTWKQVQDAFIDRQERDANENGHSGGYSGDFQTVRKVVNHDHKGIFSKHSEAQEYCLKNAVKWESVVAVKVAVTGKVEANAKVNKLRTKYEALNQVKDLAFKEMEADACGKLLGAFVTCKHCKARLPVKFTRSNGTINSLRLNCPLCDNSFASKSKQVKVTKARENAEKVRLEIDKEMEVLREKAVSKSKETEWLICGWGAS